MCQLKCHDRELITLQVNPCSTKNSSNVKIPPKSQTSVFIENGTRSFHPRSWVIFKEVISVIILKFQEGMDVERLEWMNGCTGVGRTKLASRFSSLSCIIKFLGVPQMSALPSAYYQQFMPSWKALHNSGLIQMFSVCAFLSLFSPSLSHFLHLLSASL